MIKKVSDKRKIENKEYEAKRKKHLAENPHCLAFLLGVEAINCTRKATDVHHARGRGKYFLDETTYKSLCRNCHTFYELHPDKAKEVSLSENRLD